MISSTVIKIWRPKTEGEICCCTNFKWGSNCSSCFGTGFLGGYDCVGIAQLKESFISYHIKALFHIKVGDLFVYKEVVLQIKFVQSIVFDDIFEVKAENINLIYYQVDRLRKLIS